MAVDKGRVGAVSVRGRMLLLLLSGRLFPNPRHLKHLWLIRGAVWLTRSRCGGGVQCAAPYRLHQCAPIWRCTILAAPISLISTHCETGRVYLKSGNPHPTHPPPSDRIQFVFSFSTTAINKHPVTISNSELAILHQLPPLSFSFHLLTMLMRTINRGGPFHPNFCL